MKVCCVISSLGAGGAERVMVSICNHLVEAGHAVSLVTFGTREIPFYRLDDRVHRTELDVMAHSASRAAALRNNARLMRRLRSAIKEARADVVLSFMAEVNIATLIAAVGLGVPVVVAERTYPPMQPIGHIRDRVRRLMYSRAAAVLVQSTKAAEWATRTLRVRRLDVLPNPLSESFVREDPDSGAGARDLRVVAMGRLDRGKAFDSLIRAFAMVRGRHPGWSLTIAGDGAEMSALKALAETEAPQQVHLPGVVHDPRGLLSSSAIFVLSSRYEGFPNVLLEAMACGCAVIATDCDTGPRDLIRDSSEGLLVPVDDTSALSEALDTLMASGTRREQLGANARTVRQRFAPAVVLERWTTLLSDVARPSAAAS